MFALPRWWLKLMGLSWFPTLQDVSEFLQLQMPGFLGSHFSQACVGKSVAVLSLVRHESVELCGNSTSSAAGWLLPVAAGLDQLRESFGQVRAFL